MSVYITDLANSIYLELAQPDDLNIPEIAFYLRSNIGVLNSLLFTSFSIDNATKEVTPFSGFGEDEASIYSKIYQIKYYDKQIRDNLGAAGINNVAEYSENGQTIRKFSRNEVAKSYISLRKDLAKELKDLVNAYRINRATPKDISGQEILATITQTPRFNRILGDRN